MPFVIDTSKYSFKGMTYSNEVQWDIFDLFVQNKEYQYQARPTSNRTVVPTQVLM